MSWLIYIWVTIASVITTFYHCGIAWFFAAIGKMRRKRTDKIFYNWCHSLLRIIKLKYTIVNPHNFSFQAGKRYIVMCNHTSLYDIPLSVMAIDGSMRMIAKKELSKIPLFGPAMKRNEFIFIDRKDREQAIKDLEKASELMKSGIIIWMAPEGTRSTTGELLPFKKGGFMLALQTQATIVPLGIRGAANITPNKSLKVRLGQKAEVHIGKPVDASEYGIRKRKQLMADVEQNLKQAAGLS